MKYLIEKKFQSILIDDNDIAEVHFHPDMKAMLDATEMDDTDVFGPALIITLKNGTYFKERGQVALAWWHVLSKGAYFINAI